ncbi:MAG: hypothetical protein K1X51_07425 [Rhodospirillaceae bacterium]|nr:hypothetical protein [Rhodospirillaceae bacterium]
MSPTQQTSFEPHYQANIAALADEVRRTHGNAALDYAITCMHQHLGASAWKDCALWLQIVNRLNGAPALS